MKTRTGGLARPALADVVVRPGGDDPSLGEDCTGGLAVTALLKVKTGPERNFRPQFRLNGDYRAKKVHPSGQQVPPSPNLSQRKSISLLIFIGDLRSKLQNKIQYLQI